MAVGKEIKTQIASVQSTQKITSAMEMVASSKVRRAQNAMDETRPYAKGMMKVISHIASADAEYRHPFMVERPVKREAWLLITTDRGLCGGLNSNLLKAALNDMKAAKESGTEVVAGVIGSKGRGFMKGAGVEVAAAVTGLKDRPDLSEILGVIDVLVEQFKNGEIDRLKLVSNEFINSMTQTPKITQLLPLDSSGFKDEKAGIWDYIYEPDPREILEGLLVRYVESVVYQALLENQACEQASRMIAMKAATDNAGEMIDTLQLIYNKARQAAITQEISEIVGGAAAVQ